MLNTASSAGENDQNIGGVGPCDLKKGETSEDGACAKKKGTPARKKYFTGRGREVVPSKGGGRGGFAASYLRSNRVTKEERLRNAW